MAAPQIQNGEIGLAIKRTILDQNGMIVDLAGYTTRRIIFRAPSGTIQNLTHPTLYPTYPGGGTDGVVQYIVGTQVINAVTVSILNEDGGWEMQFSLEDGTTKVIKTPIEKFQVGEKIA